MPTKKQKVKGTKINVKGKKGTSKSPTNALTLVKDKFKALKKIRAELNAVKNLYVKHNELMTELMPLFIEQTADTFIIHREIKIGNTKYRFTPFFYDEKKGTVVPKVWKSTAFESGSIE